MSNIFCGQKLWDNSEPTLELHSRAAQSVEAHHRVNSPDTGRNSGGRRIKKKLFPVKQKMCPFCNVCAHQNNGGIKISENMICNKGIFDCCVKCKTGYHFFNVPCSQAIICLSPTCSTFFKSWKSKVSYQRMCRLKLFKLSEWNVLVY